MSEHDKIKHAADVMIGYLATCGRQNTPEWMEGLAARINEYLEAVQDTDRVVTSWTGLQTITLAEFLTLDKHGHPDQ